MTVIGQDVQAQTTPRRGLGRRLLALALCLEAVVVVAVTVLTVVYAVRFARDLHETLGIQFRIDPLKLAWLLAQGVLVAVPATWSGVLLWRTSPDAVSRRSARVAVWTAFGVNALEIVAVVPALMDRNEGPGLALTGLIAGFLLLALTLALYTVLRRPPFWSHIS